MVSIKFVRAQLSDKEYNDIINKVNSGTMSNEEAAAKIGISVEEFANTVKEVREKFGTKGYGNDVQKMISYKGTIREMDLSAKNAKGGTYKLKVVNIYVKPNSERYYEEGVYSVDKDKIRTGTVDQGYHPDAALWSQTPKATPKTETAQMRRKRKPHVVVKRRKVITTKRRK